MKKMVITILFILGIFSYAGAESVKRLVLYRDAAYITVHKAPAGGSIIIDAPAGLIQESIMAQPTQTGGSIRSIEVKPGSGLTGKASDIQDQIDQMKMQQTLKKRQQETIEKEIEIIYDIAGGVKKEAAFPRSRLNESISFIDDKVGLLNAKYIKLGKERDDLKVRIRELEAQLKGVSKLQRYRITVGADGPADVSYAVRNMGWKPEYAVQAWPSKDMLLLEIEARIWQSTGTDITADEVLVSTGTPSYGIQTPELSPWHITPIRPQRNMLKAEAMAAAPLEMDGAEDREYAPPVKATETSYVIGAARNVTIPGDGSPRVVSLLKERISSNFTRAAVPKISKAAYLRAVGVWQGNAPVMAGDYTAFVDGEYCGKGYLETVEPGGNITVDLGRDEGVKIERREKTFTEKTLTGKHKYTKTITITLENMRDKKIDIKMKDQIPVSDDEGIKVDLKESAPPAKPDEDGMLNWDISLEPKTKTTVMFVFTVTGSAPGFMD
jgi:uncharacterized protein (TIGR02231 family)